MALSTSVGFGRGRGAGRDALGDRTGLGVHHALTLGDDHQSQPWHWWLLVERPRRVRAALPRKGATFQHDLGQPFTDVALRHGRRVRGQDLVGRHHVARRAVMDATVVRVDLDAAARLRGVQPVAPGGDRRLGEAAQDEVHLSDHRHALLVLSAGASAGGRTRRGVRSGCAAAAPATWTRPPVASAAAAGRALGAPTTRRRRRTPAPPHRRRPWPDRHAPRAHRRRGSPRRWPP